MCECAVERRKTYKKLLTRHFLCSMQLLIRRLWWLFYKIIFIIIYILLMLPLMPRLIPLCIMYVHIRELVFLLLFCVLNILTFFRLTLMILNYCLMLFTEWEQYMEMEPYQLHLSHIYKKGQKNFTYYRKKGSSFFILRVKIDFNYKRNYRN